MVLVRRLPRLSSKSRKVSCKSSLIGSKMLQCRVACDAVCFVCAWSHTLRQKSHQVCRFGSGFKSLAIRGQEENCHLHPQNFCACVGLSPALQFSGSDLFLIQVPNCTQDLVFEWASCVLHPGTRANTRVASKSPFMQAVIPIKSHVRIMLHRYEPETVLIRGDHTRSGDGIHRFL